MAEVRSLFSILQEKASELLSIWFWFHIDKSKPLDFSLSETFDIWIYMKI